MLCTRHIPLRYHHCFVIRQHNSLFKAQKSRNLNTMTGQTIKSALVTSWSEAPRYVEVPIPTPSDDDVPIRVVGAGLHKLVRSRATGTHYSSGTLPHVPGVDGVGHRISDDKPVYFMSFPTGGSFQEIINVPSRKVVPLPEGIDAIQVAGYINPVLSSWMALTARVTELPKGFTVLIMGATSASGSIAIEVARALGAAKVIGMARNSDKLSRVGVDEAIVLDSDNVDCSAAAHVDVILDYIYGPVAQHLLTTTKFSRPVQYVHIGSLSGQDMMLSGHVLRSKNLTIRGSGSGSFAHAELANQVPGMLEAFRKIKPQKLKVVSLSEIEKYWDEKNERIVFTP